MKQYLQHNWTKKGEDKENFTENIVVVIRHNHDSTVRHAHELNIKHGKISKTAEQVALAAYE